MSDKRDPPSSQADPELGMAEQTVHDVVIQTKSVGDHSPSDVSATTSNIASAKGDERGSTSSEIADNAEHTLINEKLLSHADDRSVDAREQLKRVDENLATPVEKGKSEATSKSASPSPELNTSSHDHPSDEVPHHAEISGGSDTDTSRATSRGPDGVKKHSHADSAKRPTFKAVSVTKSFLAKAAAASTASSKANGDKLSPSTSTTVLASSNHHGLRARLVSKSSAGLRDSSRSGANGRSGGDKGPDPLQVWNRNRPVPPPPPKHLTDEELRKQYGITMATRLDANDEGKEAKWADIDDDEDEWAPESIEWNDGTKITLSHTEKASEPEPKPAEATKPINENLERSKTPALQISSSLGPKATILKPGALAASQQAKSNILGSMRLNEKLGSASSFEAPAPLKSPWATLPPVDKISPVPMNLQGQIPRLGFRESHGFQSMPPPTKEIAADDFNRSWRDTQGGGQRELYNSQSGRYEPVASGRRPSPRNNQHFRPPSVLQRPSINDQQGPAEPSAAFQTSRSSVDASMRNRRRASSTMSGGSGGFVRRMSFGRPPDISPFPGDPMQQRRGSHQSGPSERAESPSNFPGPAHLQAQSRQSISPVYAAQSLHKDSSPNLPYARPTPYQVPGADSQNISSTEAPSSLSNNAMEDDIVAQRALQHKLMIEKRDQAIKRRKEQEEKEEAERRERIRRKMEALGMLDTKTEKEKKDEPSETVAPAAPDTLPTAESPSSGPVKTSSLPKPPVPSSEPIRYGMMTLHSPQTIKRQVRAPSIDHSTRPSPTVRTDASPKKAPAQLVAESKSSASSGTQASPEAIESQKKEVAAKTSLGSNEQPHSKIFESTSSTSSQSWSAPRGPLPSATGNVWGPPPNNQKTLGNGTFDSNLGPFVAPSLLQPNEINRPDQTYSSSPLETSDSVSIQFENIGSNAKQPNPSIQAPPVQIPSRQNIFERDVSISSQALPDGVQTQDYHPPPPINSSIPATRENYRPASSSTGTAVWNDFHAVARKDAAENMAKAAETAKILEDDRAAMHHDPAFKDTWRQPIIDEEGTRKVMNGKHAVNKQPSQAFGQAAAGFGIIGDRPNLDHMARSAAGTSHSLNGGAPRASRFFPPVDEQHAPVRKHVIAQSAEVWPPASPPPPDSPSHPAYSSDTAGIRVKLPDVKPKPIVKLPPAVRQESPVVVAPVTFAAVIARPPPPPNPAGRLVSQPIASTPTWQERFNGLFGRKQIVPDRSSSTVVNTVTKVPLEVSSDRSPASVSLPQLACDVKAATKEYEDEEALFEDRTVGSTPTVRLAKMAPSAAWQPAPTTASLREKSKHAKRIQASTIEPISFDPDGYEESNKACVKVTVHLPNLDMKEVIMTGEYADYMLSHALSKKRQNLSSKSGRYPRRNKNGPRGRETFNQRQKGSPTPPSTGSVSSPRQHYSTHWNRRASGRTAA